MKETGTGSRKSRFPILQGILPLNRSQAASDVIAGITLAAVAIPTVMGYTRIAGTPAITGLYTILLPMVVFALFGSSRHLVVGADSATAAILASGLGGLAVAGTPEYTALSGVLAVMAAVILAGARLIRLGFLADFLSHTVLIGFLTGVGIQVALGEIGGMLGLPRIGHGTVDRLAHAVRHLQQTNHYTLMTAAVVLAVILLSRKISKKIPGPLIAVIGAIAVSWVLNLQEYGVHVLGPVLKGLPKFGLPKGAMNVALIWKLLPTAFSIFVVILAQSAATSRAYAARFGENLDQNMDLVGLSLANLGAGLTGTFVVNGSPTKTEMAAGAGGRSQLAQIVTGLIVLLVLLFLTKPLEFMPVATLSAVVFVIGIDLIDVSGMKQIYRQRPAEFVVALITAVVVIFGSVEQGILLAVILSLVSHTRHGYRPRNGVIVPAKPEGWKSRPVNTNAQFLPGLMIYRFSHGMYYANSDMLSREVISLAKGAEPPLIWFCISAGAVDDIDFSAAATLRSLEKMLKEHGTKLVFAEVEDDVYSQLERSGIVDQVGRDAFFATTGDAIRAFETETGAVR